MSEERLWRPVKIDRETMEMLSHQVEHIANLFDGKEGYEDLKQDVLNLRGEILHRYIVQGDE